jgi:hypothetical protein
MSQAVQKEADIRHPDLQICEVYTVVILSTPELLP